MNKKDRILALLIDCFVIGVLYSFFDFIKFERIIHSFTLFNHVLNIKLDYFNIVFFFIYFIIFDITNDGISFGKMIMKIRVVDIDGNSLKLSKRICRTFLKTIFIYFFPINFIYYLIKKLTFQDAILKTKTIKY